MNDIETNTRENFRYPKSDSETGSSEERWHLLGTRVPKAEIVYFSQMLIVYVVRSIHERPLTLVYREEERHRALGRDATFLWSRALTHPPRCNGTRHRGRHLVSDFVGPPSWCRGGRHLGPEVVGAAILDLTS